MSRRPTIELQTLADLLCLHSVEVRCHGCGRRHQREVHALFERLHKCDWSTPLHEAATYLRCRDCGAKNAQIVIPRLRTHTQLQLVPKTPEKPWERFDAHLRRMRGRR